VTSLQSLSGTTPAWNRLHLWGARLEGVCPGAEKGSPHGRTHPSPTNLVTATVPKRHRLRLWTPSGARPTAASEQPPQKDNRSGSTPYSPGVYFHTDYDTHQPTPVPPHSEVIST
jgi:hypothetical protein